MTADVRLRPLQGPWPYLPTANRKSVPFRATWSTTKKLLAAEVEQLGGQLVVVEFDVVGGDAAFRIDGGLRANARAGDFPGVRVSFGSKHGPLTYATDQYEAVYYGQISWQANARAVALALQALRAVDRHGVTRSGEQYTGWKQLPGGAGPIAPAAPEDLPTRRAKAGRLLLENGDPESDDTLGHVLANRAAARRLFARAARKHHPDVGGDRTLFEQLVAARDLLGGES